MNLRFFWKIWDWVQWPLAVLLVLFIAASIYFVYKGRDRVLTAQAVVRIHATRLTWGDVFGPLPPQPDSITNNATLAGVDANENGIRDDVEIVIYNAHKDSAKVAAAEFQYAKELQMEFTQVFNSPTLVAVLQEGDRGYFCIKNDGGQKEVEDIVFNTQTRIDAREKIYGQYMVGYVLPNSNFCDIDPASLPN